MRAPTIMQMTPWLRLHAPALTAVFIAALGGIDISLHAVNLLQTSTPELSSNENKVTQPVSGGEAGETVIDLSSIGALNLFGKVVVKAALNPDNLPVTQLNLKIAGIFSSTEPGKSRALITESGKPAQTYFIGDALPGQATLHSIDHEFVVIQRGESMEKLPLHASSIESSSASRTAAHIVATPTPTTTSVTVAVSSANAPANLPSRAPEIAPIAVTDYGALEGRLAAIRQKKSN